MSRYSSWAYNNFRYWAVVPMHETGHIYMATDEYNGTMEYGGYLNLPDNPSTSVICIMNQNDSTRVCPDTRNQLAWRDLGADLVIEPLDVPPSATLSPSLPDPTSDPTPTWTGGSAVATLDNLNPFSNYFPPHDQTIVTISAVECRVDGGAWTPATAADGAFNGYTQGFSWTAPSLANGVHVVEARARTSVGIWSAVSAPDTLTVEGAVGVDGGSPAAALSVSAAPNPLRAGAAIEFSLAADGPARIEVYSVDGRRVRTMRADAGGARRGRVPWDGKDEKGRALPTGLYVVRLYSSAGSAMAKIVVMR